MEMHSYESLSQLTIDELYVAWLNEIPSKKIIPWCLRLRIIFCRFLGAIVMLELLNIIRRTQCFLNYVDDVAR